MPGGRRQDGRSDDELARDIGFACFTLYNSVYTYSVILGLVSYKLVKRSFWGGFLWFWGGAFIFQNWYNNRGAGRALDMGAYTGADGSVETRTSSYAK